MYEYAYYGLWRSPGSHSRSHEHDSGYGMLAFGPDRTDNWYGVSFLTSESQSSLVRNN